MGTDEDEDGGGKDRESPEQSIDKATQLHIVGFIIYLWKSCHEHFSLSMSFVAFRGISISHDWQLTGLLTVCSVAQSRHCRALLPLRTHPPAVYALS